MNEIYEVERDDYVGFIGQLNKEMMDLEEYSYQDCYFIKIKSKKTGKHLCTRIIDLETEEEKYYVFEMPDEDERIKPKGILKVELKTKEEVQAFFDAINKLQQEAHKNDGTIS